LDGVVPLLLLLLPSLLGVVGLTRESRVSHLGVGDRSVVFVADDGDGVEGVTAGTTSPPPTTSHVLPPYAFESVGW
jgi:hypothetical protein